MTVTMGLRSSWTSKYGLFINLGGWSSEPYEGSLNYLYAPDANFGPRWTHTPDIDLDRHMYAYLHTPDIDLDRHIYAYLLDFWALFASK